MSAPMSSVEAECRHAWFVASRRYAQFLRMRREYGKVMPDASHKLVAAAVIALRELERVSLPKVT